MIGAPQAMPFVDAHQHFWQPGINPYPWLRDEHLPEFRYGDYSALKKDYLPSDLIQDAQGHAPLATVHIEAEWDRADPVAETRWLTGLAARCGLPSVLVAHVPLGRPDAKAIMAEQAAFSQVRGIRCKPACTARPEQARRELPGSMDDMRWRDDYGHLSGHGLSFDLQAPWWHFDQALALALDFPDTAIIVNHTGLPADRSPEGLAAWRCAMESLAGADNVSVKISGLGQRGQPWSCASNVPVMRDAISIFGAQRCMFGSNFPVDSLVGRYADILAGFQDAISVLPEDAQQILLQGNARRIYRI